MKKVLWLCKWMYFPGFAPQELCDSGGGHRPHQEYGLPNRRSPPLLGKGHCHVSPLWVNEKLYLEKKFLKLLFLRQAIRIITWSRITFPITWVLPSWISLLKFFQVLRRKISILIINGAYFYFLFFFIRRKFGLISAYVFLAEFHPSVVQLKPGFGQGSNSIIGQVRDETLKKTPWK